jgi:hypothetical protein
MGTRSVVAEALVAEAANVERAVRLLCQSAGGGDLQAAKALIPWLNQALGMPRERVEPRVPTSLEEIEQTSTEELVALVARGREQRLQALRAVPEPADQRTGESAGNDGRRVARLQPHASHPECRRGLGATTPGLTGWGSVSGWPLSGRRFVATRQVADAP